MTKVAKEVTSYETEPSASRSALVIIKAYAVTAGVGLVIKIGAKEVLDNTSLLTTTEFTISLIVPAGQKLKLERASGGGGSTLNIETSILLL